MEKEKSLDHTALAALRGRITRILPNQVRSAVETLNDEQLWWRPNEHANSVGNLVLHVSGSMRYYLSRGVGGFAYDRNRPAEFAERGPVPTEQLLATFDEAISQAEKVFDSFNTSRFLQPSDEPDYVPTIFDVIFNVAIHLATHTGQIVYIAKMLNEGSLDELWIKAHREK
jgi:uncharacterized damage-inducible protein DinB